MPTGSAVVARPTGKQGDAPLRQVTRSRPSVAAPPARVAGVRTPTHTWRAWLLLAPVVGALVCVVFPPTDYHPLRPSAGMSPRAFLHSAKREAEQAERPALRHWMGGLLAASAGERAVEFALSSNAEPRNGDAAFLAAHTALAAGEGSLHYALRAVSGAPDSRAGYYLLAASLRSLGASDDAWRFLDVARTLRPSRVPDWLPAEMRARASGGAAPLPQPSMAGWFSVEDFAQWSQDRERYALVGDPSSALRDLRRLDAYSAFLAHGAGAILRDVRQAALLKLRVQAARGVILTTAGRAHEIQDDAVVERAASWLAVADETNEALSRLTVGLAQTRALFLTTVPVRTLAAVMCLAAAIWLCLQGAGVMDHQGHGGAAAPFSLGPVLLAALVGVLPVAALIGAAFLSPQVATLGLSPDLAAVADTLGGALLAQDRDLAVGLSSVPVEARSPALGAAVAAVPAVLVYLGCCAYTRRLLWRRAARTGLVGVLMSIVPPPVAVVHWRTVAVASAVAVFLLSAGSSVAVHIHGTRYSEPPEVCFDTSSFARVLLDTEAQAVGEATSGMGAAGPARLDDARAHARALIEHYRRADFEALQKAGLLEELPSR